MYRIQREKIVEMRFDTGVIYRAETTDEGFLRVWLSVSKVGNLEYRADNGSRQVETVTREALFDPRSLDTAWGKPITLLHPRSGLLTTQTAREESRGMTQSIRRPTQEENILTILGVVTDQETIDSIKSGKTEEVSAGYRCDVVKLDTGRLEQRNRVYNHFAIVPKGRAGSSVRVHADSMKCDSAVLWSDMQMQMQKEKVGSSNNTVTPTMATINLDGATYEVDQSIVAAIRADQKAAETTNAKLQAVWATEKEGLKAQLEKSSGEVEGLKSQLLEAQKATSDQAISSSVQARLDAWTKVLSAIQSVESDYKIDSALSVSDIKRLYLEKVHKKTNLDKYSAERIDGMYEVLRPDDKRDAVRKTLSHLDELNEVSSKGSVSKLEAARQKYKETRENVWKSKGMIV